MNGGAIPPVDGMPDALVVGAVGHAAKAVVEEAHARLCSRGEWVLDEKRMVDAAGLEAAQRPFAGRPVAAPAPADWLDSVAACLTPHHPART